MKYARMTFNRETLYKLGGLPGKIFQQMLDFLPKDYIILGFGEDSSRMQSYLFIGSNSFVDTPDGLCPPEILGIFRREVSQITGHERNFCEKIDFGNAIATQQSCTHVWKTYTGAMNVFDYCDKCGTKK